ncbi:MAG: hypothetical protein AB7P17_11305 [Nitrospirales bacterium]
MIHLTPDILWNIVKGDLSHIDCLLLADHSMIETCAALLPNLVLKKEAVQKVLMLFQSQRISSSEVQSWASFMKRGYIPGGTDPIIGIEIQYEVPYEELLAEILYRLDELGDETDGEIANEEINKFLELLGS